MVYHGRFVGYELMTTDMAAAKAFYASVVGWDAQDASLPDYAYALFTAASAPLGGLMELPQDARKMGATPRRGGSGALAGPSTCRRQTATSAALRSSPIRKWRRLRWSMG